MCANFRVSLEGFTPSTCAKFVLKIFKTERIGYKQWNQQIASKPMIFNDKRGNLRNIERFE